MQQGGIEGLQRPDDLIHRGYSSYGLIYKGGVE